MRPACASPHSLRLDLCCGGSPPRSPRAPASIRHERSGGVKRHAAAADRCQVAPHRVEILSTCPARPEEVDGDATAERNAGRIDQKRRAFAARDAGGVEKEARPDPGEVEGAIKVGEVAIRGAADLGRCRPNGYRQRDREGGSEHARQRAWPQLWNPRRHRALLHLGAQGGSCGAETGVQSPSGRGLTRCASVRRRAARRNAEVAWRRAAGRRHVESVADSRYISGHRSFGRILVATVGVHPAPDRRALSKHRQPPQPQRRGFLKTLVHRGAP
jgi:hypothetical protein